MAQVSQAATRRFAYTASVSPGLRAIPRSRPMAARASAGAAKGILAFTARLQRSTRLSLTSPKARSHAVPFGPWSHGGAMSG